MQPCTINLHKIHKMADKESFFEVSSQKAKCSRLFNGFYHSEGRNKGQWPLHNPKGQNIARYSRYSELLLTQLTETWREAVDAGLVVAAAFIDFKKASDSVSHAILEMKLERDFGISGPLLGWIRSYLSERQQFTIVNGSTSEMIPVSFGIPQGSVLGLTLFTLFTNDLPSSVSSGSVYMFADDTTVYCISETAEQSIVL